VLLSGGIIFTLAALVAQPEEGHAPSETAAVASEHDAEEQGTVGTEGEPVEHADTSEVSHDEESAGDERQSDSVLGVDLGSLNLASPRSTIVLIGLTILLAASLATRDSVWLLGATVVLGLAGVGGGVNEASSAGEELGIFVPLPILASVLYGGASCLAGLALIKPRSEAVATHSGLVPDY